MKKEHLLLWIATSSLLSLAINYTPKSIFATSHLPLIRISAPSGNQTILGSKVTVSFVVGNMTVGPEGHIHLWLDNPIQAASTAAEITTHFDYILDSISRGSHTLTLELVKPNHTSFSPPIRETVQFTTTNPQTVSPTPTPLLLPRMSRINGKMILVGMGIGIIIIGIVLLSLTRKP